MCECKQNLIVVESLKDPREKKVLSVVAKEPTNFTTIKNKTGFHQEITSRLLKRLRNKFIIRKMEGLYDICCNGNKFRR